MSSTAPVAILIKPLVKPVKAVTRRLLRVLVTYAIFLAVLNAEQMEHVLFVSLGITLVNKMHASSVALTLVVLERTEHLKLSTALIVAGLYPDVLIASLAIIGMVRVCVWSAVFLTVLNVAQTESVQIVARGITSILMEHALCVTITLVVLERCLNLIFNIVWNVHHIRHIVIPVKKGIIQMGLVIVLIAKFLVVRVVHIMEHVPFAKLGITSVNRINA